MKSFFSLFTQPKVKPEFYEDNKIQTCDFIKVKNGEKIKIIFESAVSAPRQGINLSVKGSLEIKGQTIERGCRLFYDTASPEILITVHSKKGELVVHNLWEIRDYKGDVRIEQGTGYSAMIVEETESGRRYRCNDGKPNDDFNDLVFRVERVN